MRQVILASASFLSAILLSTHEVSAQLPPPPPPGFPDYIHVLDDAYNKHDIIAYGNLFREDIKVFVDGSLVADGRPSYLDRIEKEFKRNLYVSTLSWAQGSQILALQSVRGCVPERPDPNTVYHGCSWAVAVRYDLADDFKIEAIHILEAERAWNMHSTPN